MVTAPATGSAPGAPFHFIITAQIGTDRHLTRNGIMNVPVGATRAACFEYLIQQLKGEHGPLSVLFFSLEPNQI